MKKLLCFVVVAITVGVSTWIGGWWTVPLIALIAGLLRCPAGLVAGGCTAGWLLLLLIDVAAESFGRVGTVLAGIMGLPAAALFAVTLAFPALFGWSAASLGNAARRRGLTPGSDPGVRPRIISRPPS